MTQGDPAAAYTDLLYGLLPAAFRESDAESNGQLRAVMAVLGTQYQALDANIAALYDNAFIETCEDWIIPYIGALVGVEGLDDPDFALPEQRALVGNAIAYRRRKGVAAVLQPLARAASGCYARVDEAPPDTIQTLIKISVWRLPVFGITGATPASLPPAPGQIAYGRYAFQPLGLPLQLFNVPGPPLPATRASPPAALPLALTIAIMTADLDAYWVDFGRLAPAARPANSELYGPDRGLDIALDGSVVPPAQIMLMNLTGDDIPPAAFPVFLSGPLTTMPALPAKPLVAVTFGTLGPYTIALQGSPDTLAELATSLQDALRSAGPASAAAIDPVFADAVVTVVGDQLAVVPGTLAPLIVTFTAPEQDPTTAPALGLTAPPAATLACARSASLDPFPTVPTGVPLLLMVAINGSTLRVVILAGPIGDASELASALQTGIRGGNPADPAFADAVVLASDTRVLIIPGATPKATAKGGVQITGTGSGPDLARLFGLDDRVGLDVQHGLLALPPQEAPPQSLAVSYGYAFPAALGSGPYERPAPASPAQAMTIRVAADAAVTSLGQAIALWQKAQPAAAIILIGDNGIYDADMSLALDAGWSLAIAADAQCRPTLTAANPISVSNGGASAATFGLEGVLLRGVLDLAGGPLSIAISDCTLCPPPASGAAPPAVPGGVSMIATEPIAGSAITLRRSLTGAVVVAGQDVSILVEDCVIGGVAPFGAVPFAIAGSLAPGLPGPGPALTARRATMLGAVFVTAVPLARDTIFTQSVFAADVTVGRIEYSYVPPASNLPPGYRSQPLLALEQAAAQLDLASWHDLPPDVAAAIRAAMVPRFVTASYPAGDFARLADDNAPEITQGGSRGGEMGAYAMARSAQRFALLQRVIHASLPVGCDYHFTFET
jgi:hypothetical protein